MAYIGRGTDKISNIEVLDNITFDGSSSYSITKGSVAFTPNSAQSCLISIDGVVQATNFTVSGSTIDFGTAVAGTSTCDFFLHYGTGLITTVSDGTVTTAKLGDASVTSAKLGSDVTQGITMADQWRLTAAVNSDTDLTSNLERVDNSTFGYVGTGMTESSGIFSFPSTGIYLVMAQATLVADNASQIILQTRFNVGAGYITAAQIDVGSETNSGRSSAYSSAFIDVTDIATCKAKFTTSSFDNASQLLLGDTNTNRTSFTFIRLGDT